MKTILHIAKYYYPYNGGIEAVTRQLVEGLTDYRNIVICFSSDRETVEELINGVKVYRIGVQATVLSQAISLQYGKKLRQLMKMYQPDLVHLHAPNPFVYPLVLRALPKQTMLVLHWHSDILSKGLFYHMILPWENRVLKRADLVLATSPVYMDYSPQLKKVQNKVRVLPNGVLTDDLVLRENDDHRIEKIRGNYPGKTLVLFVGRHIPYKGIDHLIRAERYIKQDVQILIAGTGPDTEYYRRLAMGRERIVFLGRLSTNDVRRYYHASDIFAFPSVNKAEAFGVALAEAMFCGAVPVTFTIPGSGVNWLSVNGETGLEVPLEDDVAYAKAIDTLAANPALREQYAKAAKARVEEHFTDAVILDTARAIYSEII
ncbi:MAG: glycosyltransferase [Paludibacteraceae bacterium]|nr:glycosyltransferase [Paludibacteraceae bacterium]